MTRTAMRANTRTPGTSARLRLNSGEPTRLSNVIILKIMPKRLNTGSAKISFVSGVCVVYARRDAKICCRILTALGRKEWSTWNEVPLELRKDIERESTEISGMHLLISWRSCFVMQMCQMMQSRL